VVSGYRKGREVVVKRLLYVNRRPPHGTIYGHEGLEVLFTGAVFDQLVTVLFLDDGVYQLVRDQDPSALGLKNYAKGFRALEELGVEAICVAKDDLATRGLVPEDLALPAALVSREEITALMESHDVILSF